MKISTTPEAIKYFVDNGGAEMISEGIAKLESENAELRKQVDAAKELRSMWGKFWEGATCEGSVQEKAEDFDTAMEEEGGKP